MRRRKKKLKTAMYRRLCIIPPFSSLSSRLAYRLVLIGLLLCVGAALAVGSATAGQEKSEKSYALIFWHRLEFRRSPVVWCQGEDPPRRRQEAALGAHFRPQWRVRPAGSRGPGRLRGMGRPRWVQV